MSFIVDNNLASTASRLRPKRFLENGGKPPELVKPPKIVIIIDAVSACPSGIQVVIGMRKLDLQTILVKIKPIGVLALGNMLLQRHQLLQRFSDMKRKQIQIHVRQTRETSISCEVNFCLGKK